MPTRRPQILRIEPGATLRQRDDMVNLLGDPGATRQTQSAAIAVPRQHLQPDRSPSGVIRRHPNRSGWCGIESGVSVVIAL
jgi:hypothetical protein